MAGRSFKDASSRRFNPKQSLAGKLLYFSGLQESEQYESLDGKLLLISEDHMASYDFNTDFVFGYVLNQPLHQRVRNVFAALPGQSISHEFQLMQIMDAGADNFEPMHLDVYTFITHKDVDVEFDRHICGDFAFYSCDTKEEAKFVGETLAKNTQTILVHSQIVLERSELIDLIKNNNVKIRDANPEIVLNRSALMRELQAFPREGYEPPKM